MDILISGSIAYDYLMHFPGKFRDSLIEQKLDKVSLSFLVQDMTKHYGGVAANIAYTLGLLGHRPRLFGVAGQDFNDYRQHLEAFGVDTSTVVIEKSVFTASFFCNTDTENNQISSFYSGAMALARNYTVQEVSGKRPDFVAISPDDPVAMNSRVVECRQAGIPYLYDPGQQLALLDAQSLQDGIDGCAILICNEYEWEIIQTRTGLSLDHATKNGRIFINTLGHNGSNIYLNGSAIHIPVYKPHQAKNPTGAGDAYRAGILRGMSLNLDWPVTGRIASLCGTYALEHDGTQEHRFTLPEFVARLRETFDDKGALDVLLSQEAV